MAHLQTDQSNTLIVEDAFYAIQTAKQAGFSVVGVYDPYESNQAKVKSLSDIYLPDYSELTDLWKFASA